METSQNGWPVDPPRHARLVPGTADVRVTVADGPAGDVLMYVLSQVDKRVEDLDLDSTRGELDDWGYASRPIRGDTVISNHASATAVDVNATRHPLGDRGTFSAAQVAEIHRILAEVGEGVVRWGGDYAGRVDEMHFEIDANQAAVTAAAARLASREDDDMSAEDARQIKAMMWTGQGVPGKVAEDTLIARVRDLERMTWAGGPVLGTVDPDSLFGRVQRLEELLAEIRDALKAGQ